MNPILYESRETDFNHNGLGKMNETLSAIVTEVANGEFEVGRYPYRWTVV